jgi:hypothetical protein
MDEGQLARAARSSRATAVLTMGGAAIVILVLVVSSLELNRLRDDVRALEQRRRTLIADNETFNTENHALDEQLAAKRAEVAKLEPFALTGLGHRDTTVTNPDVLATSVNAGELAGQLAARDVEQRPGITVRYYPKDFELDLNDKIVVPKLDSYGFRLERGVAKNKSHTNAIWAGGKVPLNDVRLVALTLIAAGVEIKCIRPFQVGGSANARLIEIGADPALTERSAVTIQAVMANGFTNMSPTARGD